MTDSPILYTAGYRRNGKRIEPAAFFASLPDLAILVDVREHRYSPGMAGYCGSPTGKIAAPVAQIRLATYRWLPELGNVRVNGRRSMPPTYKDAEAGFAQLQRLVEVYRRVVIFCSCEDAAACHRSAIAEETARRVRGLRVVHL